MPAGIWNLQWTNHNSQRSFPLVSWVTKTDRTATVTIPDDFLLWLDFPVSANLDVLPEKFFIRRLGLNVVGYAIELGYDDGSADGVLVGSVSFGAAGHQENQSYNLAGVDDFAASSGKVQIGSLASIARLPAGDYRFDPEAAYLEVACIRPQIRGLGPLIVVNGQDRSAPLYGKIELVAAQNIRLDVGVSGAGNPEVRISAISGEGLNQDCECPEAEAIGDPIRYINGIPPKPDGNFQIVGDDCITMTPVPNGIKLSDECSSPCCGSDELQQLVAQLQRFADGAATLQSFLAELRARQSQFEMNALGNKLSDQGCSEC